MRSKKDKAAKTKAPSVKPSQTTKKRGRPALSPEQKAERAKLRASEKTSSNVTPLDSVRAAKAIKAAPVKRVKKAVAESLGAPVDNWDAAVQRIATLQNMGAVHIKMGDIEVAFPPNTFTSESRFDSDYLDRMPNDRSAGGHDSEDRNTEEEIKQMAKVAEQDNPDQYAEQQDRWANHEPLPRI